MVVLWYLPHEATQFLYMGHYPIYWRKWQLVKMALQMNMRYYLGTDGANLIHFWTVNNLVKFRNFKKWLWIPKYRSLGHPAMKFQLLMSSQRGDMIIFPHPIFFHGINLSHFGLFVLGSTHFLQSIFGLWVKTKNMSFCTRMYMKPTKKQAKIR